MVLTMIGEGEAIYKGEKMSSKDALEKAGIKPLEYLSSKKKDLV